MGRLAFIESCAKFSSVTERALGPELHIHGPQVLIRVHHSGCDPRLAGSGSSSVNNADTKNGDYVNAFEFVGCSRAEVVPAPRETPRRVRGPQTAIVTGPSGEEIHTDEHGRVKVQFLWEEELGFRADASCWVRVAQMWAGSGWGTQYIPRVGMEVIVDFLDGNPDRPLVTGCVYNGLNRPPYDVPGSKTQSGIKSQSSIGGGGYNEFRFEDAKGNEEVHLRAQKNFTQEILNDHELDIGNHETIGIGGDQTLTIGGDQTRTITGNQDLSVTGDRTVQVTGALHETIVGGETRTITQGSTTSITGPTVRTFTGTVTETTAGDVTRVTTGNVTETTTGNVTETINGDVTRTVNTGNVTETVTAGELILNASLGITINSVTGINIICEPQITIVTSETKATEASLHQYGVYRGAFYAATLYVTGANLNFGGLKSDVWAVRIDVCDTKLDNKGFSWGFCGTKLRNGAISLYTYGMTIFS